MAYVLVSVYMRGDCEPSDLSIVALSVCSESHTTIESLPPPSGTNTRRPSPDDTGGDGAYHPYAQQAKCNVI
jgi:hypothetical protein